MKRALIIAMFAFAAGAVPTQAEAKPKAAKTRSARKAVRAKPQAAKKAPPTVKIKQSDLMESAPQQASNSPAPARGPTRIDFDDRLIQGQTNKSGAVYLYDRKELKVRSMVRQRESFREQIVGSVYGS
jgi:hypothetical protein